MNSAKKNNIMRSTFTALFAALICIGCMISIPLPSGVPITVQNLFALLAGCILGGFQGAGAVGIFIVLGAAGVPVFSGAHGGMTVLAGPTGGYIWGYFFGAFVAGLILGTPHIEEKKFNIKNWIKIALAALIGYAVIYVPGVLWFRHMVLSNPEHKFHAVLADMTLLQQFSKVMVWTVIPYLPGDFIKLVVTVPLTAVLRPVAARYLYPDDEKEEAELIAAMKEKKEKRDKVREALKGKNK